MSVRSPRPHCSEETAVWRSRILSLLQDRNVSACRLLLLILVLLEASCNTTPRLVPYDERTNNSFRDAPLVILGLAADDRVVGRPVQSRSELQLHRVTVQVESVLRGTIPDRSILLYYFTLANLNVDWRFLIFHEAPVRRVLWLRKDHGVYRAACDVQNCTVRIESGAHPGYHPTSAASLEQTLVDLSLTRGVGAVNNYRFVQEMGRYIGHLGLDAFTIDKLKKPRLD